MQSIMNNILEVMTRRENHTVQLESFKALVIVLHKVSSRLNEKVPRNSLLELFSNYVFNQTSYGKTIFNELCSNFLLYMMDKKYQRADEIEDDSIFTNSWFIFDLVIKSMVLHLKSENKLNNEKRTSLFDDNFARTLSRLLVNLTKYFKEHMISDTNIKFLNKNLALFIKDLLDVIDRGIGLDMIRSYLTEMTDNSLSEEGIAISADYKFEFLRIITDHESFIQLNLPFIPIIDVNLSALSKQHPLAFTTIFEVVQALKSNQEKIWKEAVKTLYAVIVKNSYDERYSEPEYKERIAGIYFVLIPLILDNWGAIDKFIALGSEILHRDLYSCILFIIENMDKELLRKWWKKEPPHIQIAFLRLHKSMVISFEYDESFIRITEPLLTPEVALFMQAAGTEEMKDLLKGFTSSKIDRNEEIKALRWVTIQADFLLLDILDLYVDDFTNHLIQEKNSNNMLNCIVDSYFVLANNIPNEWFTPAVYISLQKFILKFCNVIFTGDNNYLRDLLKPVIRHCNSTDEFVYIRATTLLYLIFQLNQRTSGSLARTRIQTVGTLSKLVSSRSIIEDLMLTNSFRRLISYSLQSYADLDISKISFDNLSDNDSDELLSQFNRNVQELVLTLSNILRDTLRVAKLPDKGEAHMKADLYYQISEGYKNTPDLRIGWLTSLAQLHVQNECFVEAGMAYMQCGAIVTNYLLCSDQLDEELLSMKIFESISPIIEEFGDVMEESVCQSKAFTQPGLINFLQCAIKCFEDGEYFEYASKIYKVLCPIYESMQAYSKLSSSYLQLQKNWNIVFEKDRERLFGKYFRVGFYGNKFGSLNRLEYIYKEPKLTHILEMSERLKNYYCLQVKDNILTLDASKSIDDIDMNQCYMQITHVEPFRESSIIKVDSLKQESFFQQNTKLSKFVYETPFTKSGKAHADNVAEQYKRKTILVVTDSFPHFLCRLPIASKYDIIMTPIENAIEDISKRNIIIENEIEKREPKTLRQVLQGSVRLQVNEGAVAICKIFLANYKEHPKDKVQSLCHCLATFLTVCRVLLALNSSFIESEDDKAFQEAMESGFQELEPQISILIRNVVYEKSDNSELSQSDSIPDFSDDDNNTVVLTRSNRRTKTDQLKKKARHQAKFPSNGGIDPPEFILDTDICTTPMTRPKVPKVQLTPKKHISVSSVSRSRSETAPPIPARPPRIPGSPLSKKSLTDEHPLNSD